jgi:hypothetical protein
MRNRRFLSCLGELACALGPGLGFAGANDFAAAPARADTYDRFGDTLVTVPPTCTGITSSEAQVAPLPGARTVFG